MHHPRFARRKPPHVVIEAGDVVPVDTAEIRHGQPAVFPRQIRMVVDPFLDRGPQSFHQGQFTFFRDDEPFAHVPHHLVEEQNHRRSIGLGQIEGRDRHLEDVLVGRGRQRDDGVIAVRSPARLVHVCLAAVGRNAGRRPAPHDIDDHTRDLGHDRVPQGLLHQRKTGSAGGGHHLVSGQ